MSRSSSGLGRPEAQAPPEVYYDALEARKYSANSRVQLVQASMAARCLELLALDPALGPRLVLDVGCGSGLSGDVLARAGHAWVGLDVSQSMLDVARARGALGSRATLGGGAGAAARAAAGAGAGAGAGVRRPRAGDAIDEDDGEDSEEEEDDDEEEEEEGEGEGEDEEGEGADGALPSSGGDALRGDMGQGFGFRAGSFDGAVSVSALQWLCYSDRRDHKAGRRLDAFFSSLYRCLRRGARAALQLYPESAAQLELVTAAALRCGFTGGVVVDFPNSTKAKKFYLCIFAGVDPAAAAAAAPRALGVGAAGGGSGSAGGRRRAGNDEGLEEEDEEDEDDEDEDDDDDGNDGISVAASSRARSTGGASRGRRFAGAGMGLSAASVTGGGGGGSGGGGGGGGGGGAGAGGAMTAGRQAHVAYEARRAAAKGPKEAALKGGRAWVLRKKAVQRLREGRAGEKVRADTRYTGRSRGPKF